MRVAAVGIDRTQAIVEAARAGRVLGHEAPAQLVVTRRRGEQAEAQRP